MKDEKTVSVLLIGMLATQLLFLGALFVRIGTVNDNISGLYQTIASLNASEKVKAVSQQKGMIHKVVGDVEAGEGPSLGPEDAPVTIVEFSDFSCNACKDAQQELKNLVEGSDGQVRLVYRHYPSPESQQAALAAECASREKAFWSMHDLLFDNFGDYEPERLYEYAARLDLDPAEFKKCMESPEIRARLERDQLAGQQYGIPGTPTYLINGRMVLGMYPQPVLEQLIDQIRREDGV